MNLKKVLSRLALGVGTVGVIVGGAAAFSAFEAHIINDTAPIENALAVDTRLLSFVFSNHVFASVALAQEVTTTVDQTALPDSSTTAPDSATTDSTVAPDSTDSSTTTDTSTITEEVAPTDTATPEPAPAPLVVSPSNPELSTDKADYQAGETITIFGKFFQSLQTIALKIFGGSQTDNNYTKSSSNVTTDTQGTFTFQYIFDNIVRPLYTVVAGSLAGDQVAETSFTQTAPPAPPASLLVKLARGLSQAQQQTVIAQNGGTETSAIPVLGLHVISTPSETLDQTVASYRADARVVSVDLDQTRTASATPSDSAYSDQWSLPKIGWDQVYGNMNPAGRAVVAVLDTGVDASHPELAGKLTNGTSILDSSAGTTDPNGHGTGMAGIIAAATDNNAGIAGIGYSGVKVMPVAVLGSDGTGQDSDIIEGVVWAVDHGANVILMSFSNPGFSESLQDALDYAWSNNVVVIAATGNDSSSAVTYPAGDRSVIGVSNTDQDDSLNTSSNYGDDTFLAAPGTQILTLAPGGSYTTLTGTSAAAAEVAGAAALMRATDPTATNGQIVARLAESADVAGTTAQTGNGRLNLARSITDTSTTSIQPNGAGPLSPGGPIVGPYTSAGGPKIDKLYTDAGLTVENYVFAVGDTVYAKATGLLSGGGYKFEAFNASGTSVYLGSCRTGATTATDSYAPTTVSTATDWKWVLHQWDGANGSTLSSSCTGTSGGEADGDNTKAFDVAQATIYSDSGLTTPQSNFPSGATTYLTVAGLISAATADYNVTWILPSAATACANTGGGDRPDSTASGVLPDPADGDDYLQYPPVSAGATNYNLSGSYESGVCPSFASGNQGQWKLRLERDATHFVTLTAFTVDTTAPTVTINQAVGQADPTTTSPINFTVVFSESVSDFATGDVTLSGTAGATTATVTGSGTTYNVAVSGMTTNGTVIASLAAAVAHDAAGNASTASTSTDNTVTFSGFPTLTVNKVVLNHGLSNDATHFAPYKIDAATVTEGASNVVDSGSHQVSEAADPNYTQTFSAECPGGSITLAPGDDKTCTITNEEKSSTLKITKNTVGGEGAFDFTVTGPSASAPSITTVSGTGSSGPTTVNSGTYAVKETIPSGWELTSASCTGGSSTFSVDTVSSIAVTPGSNITCSFTNTKHGSIMVTKFEDTNGNGQKDGGEQSPSQPVTVAVGRVTGPAENDGRIPIEIVALSLTGGNGIATLHDIPPGDYKLFEEKKTGWVPTAPSPGPAIDSFFDITYRIDLQPQQKPLADSFFDVFVEAGQTADQGCQGTPSPTPVTCQYGPLQFGNFKLITVHVQKDVVDPNGGPVNDNHSFNVKLDNEQDPGSAINEGLEALYGGVRPGQHTLVETGDPDFDLLSIKNGNADLPNGQFTPTSGQDMTIMLTNRQKPGKIIIDKTANGGDDTFTFSGNHRLGNKQVTTTGGHSVAADSFFDVFTDLGSEFTITEGPQTGWIADATACVVTVKPGQTKICSFTNTKQTQLTVTKLVITHGGVKQVSDFPLFIDQTSVTSGVSNLLDPGTYTVSETGDSNYTATVSGDCAADGSITLAAGDVKSCTITNEEKTSTITVKKVVVDHGLGFTASHFADFKVDTKIVALDLATAFNSGDHTVSEAADSNYDTVFTGACDKGGLIHLAPGTDVICTITNTEKPSKLIVNKVVKNHGSDKKIKDFPLTVDGNGVTSGEENTFDSGTYTVSETGNNDYIAVFSGDCDPDTHLVNLVPGTTKTCAITNEEKFGNLIIKKESLGGFGQFDFTVTSQNPENPGIAPFSIETSQNENPKANSFFDIFTDVYNIQETAPSRWNKTSAVCDNNDSINSVHVGPGQTVTCVFTNKKQAHITVTKTTVGADGNFHFTGLNSPNGFDIDTTGQLNHSSFFDIFTEVSLDGTDFNVNEDLATGWTTEKQCDLSHVLPGEEKTCTFTNTKDGSITVTKFEDLNGNGQQDTNELGLPGVTVAVGRQTGPPHGTNNTVPIEIVALSLTGANGIATFPDIAPGNLKVFEEKKDGWTPTTPWNVDSFFDITYKIDLLPQQKPLEQHSFFDVLVQPGQTADHGCQGTPSPIPVTCQIVPLEFGNFKLITVTVEKELLDPSGHPVTNDPHQFTVKLDGGDPKPIDAINDGLEAVYDGVRPGPHTLTEVVPGDPDFDLLRITAGNTVLPNGEFIPTSGQDVTIVVTNGQHPGKIIVHKIVKDPSGNNIVADHHGFTARLNGGSLQPLADDANATFDNLNPGAYTISELTDSGYELVGIIPGQPVSVASGQTVEVTITNKQKSGKIIISKKTNGGFGSFSFDVDHGLGNRQVTTDAGHNPNIDSFFDVFTELGSEFTVTEQSETGWTGDETRCKVTVNPGEEKTCEFTNTKLPTLTVIKTLVPANDTGLFNLQIDTVNKATNVGDAGTTGAVITTAGPHTVGEVAGTATNLADYTSVIGGGCAADGAITLVNGDNKTCTITNYKKIRIEIVKTAIGGDGTFHFKTPGQPNGLTLNTAEGQDHRISSFFDIFTEISLDGTYVVTEDPAEGWSVGQPCILEGLKPGDEKTCEFTNTKKGTITIKKVTVGGDDSFAFAGDVAGALSNGQSATAAVAPGAYTSTETVLPGWVLTDITCVDPSNDSSGVTGAGIATFNVAPGENVTCAFTNTKKAKLTVTKVTVGGTGKFHFTGSGTVGEFDLDTTSQPNNRIFSFFDIFVDVAITPNGAGVTVNEQPEPGWSTDKPSCDVTLLPGDEKECVFINTKDSHIIVKKVTNPANDPSQFSFTTTGAGYLGFNLTGGGSNDQSLVAGNYSVSETPVANWTSDNGVCDQGQTPANIVLAAGQTVTCTFINTFVAPLAITQEATSTPTQTTITIVWTTNHPATSRVVYEANNSHPDPLGSSICPAPNAAFDCYGYANSTGETDTGVGMTTNHSVVVTGLTPGTTYYFRAVSHGSPETASNEIVGTTNQPQPQIATLIVKKVVSGGSKLPADFTMQVSGTTPSPNTFSGSAAGTSVTLGNGAYSVSEILVANYTPGYSADCSGSIAAGQTKTCTVTNTYQPNPPPGKGRIKVVKKTSGGNGVFYFTGSLGNFSIKTEDGSGSRTFSNLPAGNSYSVNEIVPNGWTMLSNTCQNVVVVLNQTVTCTVTNAKVQQPKGKISGKKFEDLNGNGVRNFGENYLSGWTIYLDLNNNGQKDLGEPSNVTNSGGEYSFSNLAAGTYIVREVQKPGWTQTAPASGKHTVVLSTNTSTAGGKDFGNRRNRR